MKFNKETAKSVKSVVALLAGIGAEKLVFDIAVATKQKKYGMFDLAALMAFDVTAGLGTWLVAETVGNSIIDATEEAINKIKEAAAKEKEAAETNDICATEDDFVDETEKED